MRQLSLPLAALLGAALSLLPGCESMKSSNPSPTDTPSQKAEPLRGESAGSAWKSARVGDRVTYAFSAQVGGPRTPARSLTGRASVEVVAVEQPWVWVRLAFTDERGEPLSPPRLAEELLLPVRAEETRPLKLEPEGEASAERPATAGRTWEAMRYVNDMRPVDGPRRTRVYAVQPGPLYLTHGLLEASNVLAGFLTQGNIQLTLVDYREGPAEATATPERLPDPGAYHDWPLEVGDGPMEQPACYAAERGFVLRAERASEGAPCPDFSRAEAYPLEEVLLERVWQAVATGGQP